MGDARKPDQIDQEYMRARAELARVRTNANDLRHVRTGDAGLRLVQAMDAQRVAEERVRDLRIELTLAGGWPRI